MPINFGDIAGHHKRIAARHFRLAQAARDCGNHPEAKYHAELAVRYVQAAEEQGIAMRQAPGRFIEEKRPGRLFKAPERVSPAPARLLAILRGAGYLAAVILQSISGRSASSQGLSLR